jgi:transposase, IS5 family
VYYQFFSGREYYEPKAPCDFTLISKFRKLICEEGVEELLDKTITVAVEIGLIKPEELKKVWSLTLRPCPRPLPTPQTPSS